VHDRCPVGLQDQFPGESRDPSTHRSCGREVDPGPCSLPGAGLRRGSAPIPCHEQGITSCNGIRLFRGLSSPGFVSSRVSVFVSSAGKKAGARCPGEGEALTTDSGFSDYAGCSVAFRDTRELGCTLEKPRIPPRAKAKTSLGWMPDCRVDVCQKKARRSGPKVRVFAYCGDGAGDPFAAQKKRSWWLLVSCNCASVGAVVNWLPLLFAIERSTVSCQSPF